MGLDSLTDISDTQSTAAKKSGVFALGATTTDAPTTDRAVMLTLARDEDAVSQLRHAQVVITEPGNMYWAEENNGTLGNWQRVVSEDATQTLRNKTLVDVASMNVLGSVSKPGIPAFSAKASGTINNVTGNGTIYTVVFAEETFDQTSSFDGTSTFTAPVSGKYLLTTTVTMQGITSAADEVALTINTSNRNYLFDEINANNLGSLRSFEMTVIADMEANDTATVTIAGTGEASDVWDVNTDRTRFFGCLLA